MLSVFCRAHKVAAPAGLRCIRFNFRSKLGKNRMLTTTSQDAKKVKTTWLLLELKYIHTQAHCHRSFIAIRKLARSSCS